VSAKDKILAALGAVATIFAFIFVWRWKKDHVNRLKDALSVKDAEKDMAVLNEKRRIANLRVEAKEGEVEEIDEKLAENRRTIVEARTSAKDLDEEAILEEYRRLGYIE
jgi:hypothetical protein